MNGGPGSPRGRGGRGRGSNNGTGASTPNRPARGQNTPRGGYDTPRGRGGRKATVYQQFVEDPELEYGSGRGRGGRSPRGLGGDAYARGRGGRNLKSKLHGGASLSKLLYEDRPLLRPIMFVPSLATPKLFQDEEELLQPLAEEAGELHVISHGV